MIDDLLVIDAVVHPFNLDPENDNGGEGQVQYELMWGLHQGWNPPDVQVAEDVFHTDWTTEQLTDMLFKESAVDIAVNHHLPLYSWWKDGSVGRHKNVEIAERWPDRYLLYAGIDPTQGTQASIELIDAQVAECPQAFVGLKMYPTQINPYRNARMDDEALMYPIYEHAAKLGMKTVAVHKALPNGPVPINPFRPEDVDKAAGDFPHLNFEIVHAGLAFSEETAQACARYPNVYANLETTFMLATKAPGWFEEILGYFATWSGYEKLLFSSGAMYSHPQHQLEAFMKFEFSEQTLNKYGLQQITREDKAKILGLNFARVVDLDVEAAKAKIADDQFAQYQREHGPDAPFSNWEASVREGAAA